MGEAGAEAELIDSLTGERLMAAVDRRVGTKQFKNMTKKWDDVQSAYDHWAMRLRERLAELRRHPGPDRRQL